MHYRVRNTGFTLIELAITIVIIGLLMGGVVVGQILIRSAHIRSTVSQYQKFNSATVSFKEKYACLPGDCKDVTQWGFDVTSAGTGEGWIGVGNDYTTCHFAVINCTPQKEGEYTNFWYHLSVAGLIPQVILPYTGAIAPKNKLAGIASPSTSLQSPVATAVSGYAGNGWAVHPATAFDSAYGGEPLRGHSLVLGFQYTYPGQFEGYAPADIEAIDVKLDDGLPTSGKARGMGSPIISWGSPDPSALTYGGMALGLGPAGSDEPYCVINTALPLQYNIRYAGGAANFGYGNCTLFILTDF